LFSHVGYIHSNYLFQQLHHAIQLAAASSKGCEKPQQGRKKSSTNKFGRLIRGVGNSNLGNVFPKKDKGKKKK